MLEETGVAEQEIQLYRTITPHFLFGSDTTSRNFHAVAFLAKDIYEKWVPTDGGLHVFAFHPTEVLRNIQRGAIVSGQAVIMPWFFYEKVMAIRHRRGGYGWDELITDEMVKLA